MPSNKLGSTNKKIYNKFWFFFKIINSIKLILVLPFIFIIVLIYPFIKIRFGEIKTKTLGNCVLPIEIFYYENKENVNPSNKGLNLWCADYIVANNFWLKKIKKKIYVLPGVIIKPIFSFFKSFKYGHKFLVPMRNLETSINPSLINNIEDLSPHSDIYGVLKKKPPLITFTKEENNLGENFLKKIGIDLNDKFVCIHSRSNSYRNENFNSVRNSSIKNLEMSCKFLNESGFKVIRVGRDEKIKFEFSNNDVFDYATSELQSDLLDFFIISKCLFFVGGDSGLADVAKIFRKPIMLHNILNLKDIIHYVGDSEKVILPKKIWSRNNKKFLSFTETLNNNYSQINYEDLHKKGLELLENSEEEILQAVKEMVDYTVRGEKNKQDQSIFFDNFEKIYPNPLVKKLWISKEFYKNNIDLFENDV